MAKVVGTGRDAEDNKTVRNDGKVVGLVGEHVRVVSGDVALVHIHVEAMFCEDGCDG